MMITDPIADMLTRIRNGNMVRHASVDVPASNTKKSVLLRSFFQKVSLRAMMSSTMASKVSSVFN